MMGAFRLLCWALLVDVIHSQCQVCSDGSPIPLTYQEIIVPGFSFVNTCGEIPAILPLLPDNSTQCSTLQSLESICGCPVRDNACQLCESNDENLADRELPFLSFLFDGIIPTCEIYEAYLRSFNDTSSDCIVGQEFISEYCGCGGTEPAKDEESCSICPGGEMIGNSDANIDIPPFRTCHELDQAVDYVVKAGTQQCDLVQSVSTLCGCEGPPNPCTLCWDGSSVVYPDKDVEWAKDLFLGIVPTCSLFEAYVAGLSFDDSTCEFAQSTGTFCGCPPLEEDHCVFCDEGFPEESSDVIPRFFPGIDSIPPDIEATCELIEPIQYSLASRDRSCSWAREAAYQCGCHGGILHYWGTDSEATRILLVVLMRFSSVLSILGASAIKYDILRNPSRRKLIYTQLVWYMSSLDLMSAIALMFGPAAMNDAEDFFGTRGNDATCKTQAFFVELGLTSIFVNVSLTFYYKLTILDGWKEDKFRQKRLLFFGIPTLVGVTMAFASLPFYGPNGLFCLFNTMPLWETYPQIIILGVLPIAAGIFLLTGVILYVYFQFRRQQRTSERWRFEREMERRGRDETTTTTTSTENRARRSLANSLSIPNLVARGIRTIAEERQARRERNKNKLTEQVLGQAVSYMLAFHITWPAILIALIYGGYPDNGLTDIWFWCFVAIASPLQGFSNAVIYFRPRIQRARKLAAKKRKVAKDSRFFRSLRWLQWSLRWRAKPQRESGSFSIEDPAFISERSESICYEPAAALARDDMLDAHIAEFDERNSIHTIMQDKEEEEE